MRLAGTMAHVDGADLYQASAYWVDDETLTTVGWAQIYTARYAGDQAIDYVYPDLSAVGGWNVGLLPGAIYWSHLVTSSTGVTLPVGYPPPTVLGDTRTVSSTYGVLTAQ